MHERKTLMIRNPGRPTMERLPCRLTRDEKLARMDRTDAIERTIEQHEAEIAAIKAKAKAAVDEVQTKVADLQTERKKVRNERIAGFEERLVECELLEDAGEGVLYVFRLDTLEVAQRRDMAPHEQRELQLEGRSSRTVDIPDDVASVVRFDSDPPGTGDEEDDDGEEVPQADALDEGEASALGLPPGWPRSWRGGEWPVKVERDELMLRESDVHDVFLRLQPGGTTIPVLLGGRDGVGPIDWLERQRVAYALRLLSGVGLAAKVGRGAWAPTPPVPAAEPEPGRSDTLPEAGDITRPRLSEPETKADAMLADAGETAAAWAM